MPTVPYTFELHENGVQVVVDLEVEIDCQVDLDWGEVTVTPLGVFISDGNKRVDLLVSDNALTVALARDIQTAAEGDDDFLDRAAELAGLTYRSRGSNDPEASWVEAA